MFNPGHSTQNSDAVTFSRHPSMTRSPSPLPLISALLPALVLVLLVAGSISTHAQTPKDPLAHWRDQIENARRLTVPPPPKGVRDARWNELSPPGWNPGQILQRLGVATLGDDDPRAKEIEAEIRREWDNAPTAVPPDEAPIRLTGYPVFLAGGDTLARTILLVPYHGACIHRPAPPANQMVLVSFKQGLPRNMDNAPIWITGKVHALSTQTLHGRVAYTMLDAKWQKYPVEKYPLPQYIPLR